MKIAVIGSCKFKDKEILDHVGHLEVHGHLVRIPVFDNHDDTPPIELRILRANRELVEWADEVHVLWDGDSRGTIGDFMMAFAFRKPVKIIRMDGYGPAYNKKTWGNAMLQYETYYEDDL
jgi:hypothetical protein